MDTQISLPDLRRAAANAALVQKFIALDSLRKDYVEMSGSDAFKGEEKVFQELTREMTKLMRTIGNEAAWLNDLMVKMSHQIETQFSAMIKASDLTNEAKLTMTSKLIAKGGLRDLIKRASEQLPSQVSEIEETLSRVTGTEKPVLFIKKETLCMLEGVGIGVCVVIGQFGAAIGIGLKCLSDCF